MYLDHVVLSHATLDHARDDFVGDEFAGVHELLGGSAVGRSRGHFGTEKVARGDVGELERVDDELALGALSGSGGPRDEDLLRRSSLNLNNIYKDTSARSE